MTDARPIGYGGMLGEGALGMLAVLATTAGFSSRAEWLQHYGSWGAAQGLSAEGPPTYAYYNDPWTPGFLRRNEVMIGVE